MATVDFVNSLVEGFYNIFFNLPSLFLSLFNAIINFFVSILSFLLAFISIGLSLVVFITLHFPIMLLWTEGCITGMAYFKGRKHHSELLRIWAYYNVIFLKGLVHVTAKLIDYIKKIFIESVHILMKIGEILLSVLDILIPDWL